MAWCFRKIVLDFFLESAILLIMNKKSDKQVLKEMFERNKIKYQERYNHFYVKRNRAYFVTKFEFNEDESLKEVEAYVK